MYNATANGKSWCTSLHQTTNPLTTSLNGRKQKKDQATQTFKESSHTSLTMQTKLLQSGIPNMSKRNPVKKQAETPHQNISVFSQDKACYQLNSATGVQVLREPAEMYSADNLIVVSSYQKLADIAPYVSDANHRNSLRVLLLRNDDSPHWTTRFLYAAGLRTLRNLLVHSGENVPKRIIEAWSAGAQHKLIADATVQDDKLLVLDCALKLYELRFDSIKELSRLPVEDRTKFTIDADGSDISWTGYDISIDIQAIESVLNPTKPKLLKQVHDKKFGQAIASFRNLNKLRQSDIPGLTERQIRRIEKGDTGATLKSLTALAKAHKLSLKSYMNKVAEHVQPPAPIHHP